MVDNVQRVILTADDKTRAAFTSFRANIKGATDSTNVLNKASTTLTRGLGALGIGFSAFSVLKGAISQTGEFNSALVGVSKTTGLTGQGLEDFADRMDGLSKRIPVTTGELLDLSQAAGQMGVTGADNLEKFATTVAKLDRASDLAGESAAKSLARILNVTGESVDSVDVLASVIVSLGNNSAASEAEIARMTTEVARATSAFDVSSAEAAAMSAAMASIGIQAELGGSSVGRVMQEITSRVQAGGRSLDQFATALNLDGEALANLFADNKVAAFEFFLQNVGELGLDAGNALKSVGLGGQEIAKTIIPLSTNMDIFARSLQLANEEVKEATALDREFEAGLDTLTTQWQITKNITESWARSLGEKLVPALNAGLLSLNAFFSGAAAGSEIQQQIELISSLEAELKHLTGLSSVFGFLGPNQKDFDLLEFQIESAKEDLNGMREAAKALEDQLPKTAAKVEELNKPLNKTGDNAGGASNKALQFVAALKKEAGQAGLTATEIKKLEAASLGVSRIADPLIDRIEDTNNELAEQSKIAKLLEDDLSKIESITRSVRTEEEIFTDTVRELDRLLEQGLGAEIYTRALQQAEDALNEVSDKTVKVTDEFSRLWDQAGRRTQSILSDSIFNFFDDGLDGMARNAKSAVGRIASEFAGLKLAQSVGLQAIFSGGSGGGPGGSNSASNALSLASLTASGFDLLPSARSAFTAGTGGAGTAFIGGPGTAVGGSGLGASGFSGLSGLATGGLVLGAGIATQQFNELIENNKRVGGLSSNTIDAFTNPLTQVPVIGDLLPSIGSVITGLFGRGPLKQRRTTFDATLGAEGIEEGFLNTAFRAKGGVFRKNKNDFARVDLITGQIETDNKKLNEFAAALADQSTGIISIINDSVTAVTGSLRDVGDSLDLSTVQLDSYKRDIQLVSEKGEFLTEQQIGDEIAIITDQLAHRLIPEIDNLAKRGEPAFQAVQRLNAEFGALTSVMQVVGKTSEQSRDAILGTNIEERSRLVELAGGSEVLNAKTQALFGLLPDEDKLRILSDNLLIELNKVGVQKIPSLETFLDAMKSGTLTLEQFNAGLNLQGDIAVIDSLKNAISGGDLNEASAANDAFGALSNSVNIRQLEIAKEIGGVSSAINELSGVTNLLRGAVNTIQPIGKTQARELIKQAANDSDFNNPRLGLAINALTKSSTDDFKTLVDFQRDQIKSANSLRELEDAANDQLSIEQQTLAVLEDEQRYLNGLLSNAQLQLDALNDINANLSISQSLADFNTSSILAGGGGVAGPGGTIPFTPQTGAARATDQQIIDFASRENVTSRDLFDAAFANNIPTDRVIDVLNLDPANVARFLDENNLPRLRTGVNEIPHDMPAFLHAGEEVKPKAFVDTERKERKELTDVMNKVLTAIEVSVVSNNKVKKTLAKWEKVGMPKERAA